MPKHRKIAPGLLAGLMAVGILATCGSLIAQNEITVKLTVNPPRATPKGFRVTGTISADGPVKQPGCTHAYSVTITAHIKQQTGSKYPRLKKNLFLQIPPGAKTNLAPGSGPGGTMTKIEAEGFALKSMILWKGGLCRQCPFEAYIPLEYHDKQIRILASVNHQRNCINAAYLYTDFHNDIGYEGKLPEFDPKILNKPHNIIVESGPAGDPNPAKAKQSVACSIKARCDQGHSLIYKWYAEDGVFDRTDAADVIWSAPENCSDNEKTYRIGCRVTCAQDASVQETRSFQQRVKPQEKLPLAEILSMYNTFGTTAHTWPDGTTEAKPLVGKTGSGVMNNILASATAAKNALKFWKKGKNPYTRYECDAMQYKVMCGFLQKLKDAGLLDCWEFKAVEGVSPPYPVHHAVVLWQKGTDWQRNGIILDPHGHQKPHYSTTEVHLFDWHLEVTRDGRYNYVDPCALAPPWQDQGGSEKSAAGKGFAVMCPVDVFITNSRGQRLGVGPSGRYLEEFPPLDNSFYMDEKGEKQWFFFLPDDTYTVQMTGTGNGSFRLVTATNSGQLHDYGTHPILKEQQHRLVMEAADDRLILADGTTPPYQPVTAEALHRQSSPEPAGTGDRPQANPPQTAEGVPATFILAGLGILALLLLLFVLGLSRKPANRKK